MVMEPVGSFRSLLRPASRLKYLFWRLSARKWEIEVAFNSGTRIKLRRAGRNFNDYGVAYEVFVFRYYECPVPVEASNVKVIVDLGAHVGFSCLYWANKYPHSSILAFEPHPIHSEILLEHVALNAISHRVDVRRGAAGIALGEAVLSDAGSSSSIVKGRLKGIRVPVYDVFSEISSRPIDILKIDIEGSEYPLLSDRRFATLDVALIVLEWHATNDHPNGREWCLKRFAELGYRTIETVVQPTTGMIWAVR